jgi:nitrogen fixation protein FixH
MILKYFMVAEVVMSKSMIHAGSGLPARQNEYRAGRLNLNVSVQAARQKDVSGWQA